MSWENYPEPNQDDLRQAEIEAMERPADSAMYDKRLYVTHAPVITHALNSDDVLSESNYEQITAYLIAVAGERDEDVLDLRLSHWAVGPIAQTFVRVRDEHGNFTQAWKDAVAIGLYLRDYYPVFDEDDYSRREDECWHRDVTHEVEHLSWWSEEIDGENVAIKLRALTVADLAQQFAPGERPSHADIVFTYGQARDEYYEGLVEDFLRPLEIPGQGVLL